VDPQELADEIDAGLRRRSDPGRAARERAYLKSSTEHYGVPVPAIRALARDVRRRLPDLDHHDLVAVVDALWGAGPREAAIHERRMAAVELLRAFGHLLSHADLALAER
jgi:hypothetical protein